MEARALPLGFGMALSQNEQAMHRFAQLTEAQKRAVVQRTHAVRSKSEMQQLVQGLADGTLGGGI